MTMLSLIGRKSMNYRRLIKDSGGMSIQKPAEPPTVECSRLQWQASS